MDHPDEIMAHGMRVVAEVLMELEVGERVGAGLYKRSPDRRNHRNGYRMKVWYTRAGEVSLRIPKLRKGSYFPSFLEAGGQVEPAILSLVRDTYSLGVTPQQVEGLMQLLNLEGISKAAVLRVCRALDAGVAKPG